MDEELLCRSIHNAIVKLLYINAHPSKVVINNKYKDLGKYYYSGTEFETIFWIPLEFGDTGRLAYIVECEEFV